MGTVFRAWQDELARAVAVKTLRPELARDPALRARFVQEARILAALDHPGIVTVHACGETDAGPYYVMRLVEGASIDAHLAGRPHGEVAAVFHSVAEALAEAHAQGVLHRDVKPQNVVVEPAGRPVLVDFGLASRAAVAQREEIAGTPDYLAPELLEGAAPSVASDVYALGATLYTVLTGQVPFPADDLVEKLRAIGADDPPLPRTLRPDVPKALQAICLKAMERAPADRYASAAEMARDLERFRKGDFVAALPVRSRSMLRRKAELHVAEIREWADQGLLDDRQRGVLEHAYEQVDEQERGLLRGVLGSIPNLLLLAGILLCVFGPLLLQLLTWDQQGAALRIGLPAAPFALLLGLGLWRWRASDRRRAVACLFGASLLAAPLAFGLADLVPALRAVPDDAGVLHAVRLGDLWEPAPDAPEWMRAGSVLLDWKLLITMAAVLALSAELFRRTRAAAFLWVAVLAGIWTTVFLARGSGWGELPGGVRWAAALLSALGTAALGVPFDRAFQRDRALPFYGLGFMATAVAALAYIGEGMPFRLLGVEGQELASRWACGFHGLLFSAAGFAAHARGSPLLRQTAGLPLCAGFVLAYLGVATWATDGSTWAELLLIATAIAHLLLGLALHRNSLVLLAAVVLPFAVGTVTQRHVQALWAWSAAVVLSGALLVALSFRIGAQRAAPGRFR